MRGQWGGREETWRESYESGLRHPRPQFGRLTLACANCSRVRPRPATASTTDVLAVASRCSKLWACACLTGSSSSSAYINTLVSMAFMQLVSGVAYAAE